MDNNKNKIITKAIADNIRKGNVNIIDIGLYNSHHESPIPFTHMSSQDKFELLLSKNNIQQLIDEFIAALNESKQNDLYDNMLLISSRYNRNEEKSRRGTISEADYNLETNKIINSIKEYLKEYKPNTSKTVVQNGQKKIFLSYNHKDKIIANRIKLELEKFGIDVTIDSENMLAGDDIKNFIEESIKHTNVTMSLVSSNSLMSAWVAMESINTIYAQKTVEKQFIAAFIDSAFFKRDFVDRALNKIEKEIEKIKKQISVRLAKNRNITDLQSELERYNDLNHSLPKIIQRLKDSMSINITGENFQAGIIKIVQSIKS